MRLVVFAMVGACGSQPPVAEPPGVAAAPSRVAPAPDAAPEAPVHVATPDPMPPVCIPRDEPDWTCPELGVAAIGERAIVCLRERCGETGAIGCMIVEPRTGKAVGAARWPTPAPPDPQPPPPFELFAEGRTIAVCRGESCNRIPDALPVGTSDLTSVAVNAQGTQVFVLESADRATTYSVAKHARIAHFSFDFHGGPPPPTSEADLAYFGQGILLGDFANAGTYDRAIDPITGLRIYLDKPWVRLPGDLVVHYDGIGEVELYDFDAHLRKIARRKAGRPHQPTEAASGELVVVGANALVVTQDPPTTVFVDSKARTISRPHPLAWCAP